MDDIKQPRDATFTTETGKVRLTFNTMFGQMKTAQFRAAQKYIDGEVLRLCSPLVPFRTGNLEKSGTLGTTIGSGVVEYNAPYARVQYYTAETRSYDAQRGGKWFERMKSAHKDEILRGAKKLL